MKYYILSDVTRDSLKDKPTYDNPTQLKHDGTERGLIGQSQTHIILNGIMYEPSEAF